MKVGIITLPIAENYGGILQAYALSRVLSEHFGVDNYILQSAPETVVQKIKLFIESFNPFYQFRERHLRILRVDFEQLNSVCRNHRINTIIVGSDQVWRMLPAEVAFLDNLNDVGGEVIKRISYAASFGIDKYPYNEAQHKIILNNISHFSNVSVREFSAVNICKEKWNVNAEWVLDPTMLLGGDFYKSLTDKVSGEYVYSYLLDSDSNANKKIEMHLKNVLNMPLHKNILIKNKILKRIIKKQTVNQWISEISNAHIVITDSFHACVFSILFHKTFYVVPNNKGGNARIESLLEMFGLKDRIIDANSGISTISYITGWNRIDKILLERRKQSLDFLRLALYGENC